jgi:nicotinamidase-related amidase
VAPDLAKAILGTLLLAGGAWMVAETRLSGNQIQEEIRHTNAAGGTHAMSYFPLDPTNAVILFADLQAGILELSGTHDPARLRRAVGALARLARLYEIPAIVTTAPAEGGEARVTPEIAASLGALPQHVRTTTDAFTHQATRDAIARTGKKTLLIAGVATEIIVQHSALSGVTQGYHVQVVVDACGGISPRTEDAALRRLVQAGVVTTSIASIAGQLAGDFSRPKGAEAIRVLYEMASG